MYLGYFSYFKGTEKNERTRRGSPATAAFQAGRLIPFLARQKTKGHLEGYRGKEDMAGSCEMEEKPRVVGSRKERQDEEEAEGVPRIYIPVRKRPRFIPPGARYPRAECLTDC